MTDFAQQHYNRRRDLPLHFAITEEEMDHSIEAREVLLDKIRAACARETMRGMNCQWPYDYARHNGMLTCLRMEAQQLRKLKEQTSS